MYKPKIADIIRPSLTIDAKLVAKSGGVLSVAVCPFLSAKNPCSQKGEFANIMRFPR